MGTRAMNEGHALYSRSSRLSIVHTSLYLNMNNKILFKYLVYGIVTVEGTISLTIACQEGYLPKIWKFALLEYEIWKEMIDPATQIESIMVRLATLEFTNHLCICLYLYSVVVGITHH